MSRNIELPPADTVPDPSHSLSLGPLVGLGNFMFRYRNTLFPVVLLLIALLSNPMAPFGSEAWDRAMDLLGIVVALCGQVLRACVIGFAYIQRGGKNRRIHADQLVQEGFFAHSRNPLYLGNLLVLLGLFIVLNSWLGYLVGMPFFLLAYAAIVAAEEDFLRRQFGEPYEDYCRRVNRFALQLRGLRGSLAGMGFDWRRLIRKEYGSTFSWMTMALALLVWQVGRRHGMTATGTILKVALPIWGILIGAYLVARTLKKKKRLNAPPLTATD